MDYYPTLLHRVQITRETNHTIFVLVSFPQPRERLTTLASQNFEEMLDNKSLIQYFGV